MKNQLFLMTVFCLISNMACSMHKDAPNLSSCDPILLSPRSKDNLLRFVKDHYVAQGQISENAELSLNTFVRDDLRNQNPVRGQKYFIEVAATWLTFVSVPSQSDLRVLQLQKHGCDLGFGMFEDSLKLAKVNLPK